MKANVLMVGPGRKTNGGITKVIEYYRSTSFWSRLNVYWVESYCTGSSIDKIATFLHALLSYLVRAPSAKLTHLHFTGSTSANRKLFFYFLAKAFGHKVVCHIHAPNLDDLGTIANRAFLHLISNSDHVIVLTDLWRRALSALVPRQYVVLSNPSEGFLDEKVDKENIILFAGKLEDRKGYLDLIQAFAAVSNKFGYSLVLAGDGNVDLARAKMNELGVREGSATGWLAGDDIRSLFRRAKIFVLPSYGEGFPISIIDALSNKCAVVATPVGGIPDVLEDMNTCLYVQPGNVSQLTYALSRLVSDEALVQELSSRGFILAKEKFDKNRITGALEDIYREILR